MEEGEASHKCDESKGESVDGMDQVSVEHGGGSEARVIRAIDEQYSGTF